jgi:serine/threonine protein kinase
MAPEATTDSSLISNKSDVFSYGSLTYRMFTMNFGLQGREFQDQEQFLELSRQGERLIRQGERLIRVPEITDTLWELISECWSQEPQDRPSFAEITDRMLKSNDFVLDRTNLSEYHEYQQRIMSELNACPIRVNNSAILESLQCLGLYIDSLRGITI